MKVITNIQCGELFQLVRQTQLLIPYPLRSIGATIKKNTKSRYKYEVRRLKRQADHIKSEKLAGAWCNSRTNDLWNLVRQNRGNSKFSGCNVIDGLTTDDISSMFSLFSDAFIFAKILSSLE